jgi:hypothetical protein
MIQLREPGVDGAYGSETIGPAVASHGGLVQVNITLVGVTPLLMNAMSEAELLRLWDKTKPPKSAGRPKPREAAASRVHQLPDGRPHVPLMAFYKTLINAGQFIRLDGKRQITTDKKTILPGMLTVLSNLLPLTRPGTDESTRWEVDIQQGRNPNGGEAVCIIRPRFDEWQLCCTVEVDQEQMPLTMARDLVDIAGKRIGLLEYTPRHKGTFGRFNVTAWAVVPRE